jgi:hypothetical protein
MIRKNNWKLLQQIIREITAPIIVLLEKVMIMGQQLIISQSMEKVENFS